MRRIILALFCALVATGCNDWRMWETPAVKPHEVPLLVMDGQTVPLADAEAVYRLTDGKALRSPVSAEDPEVLAAGEAGYQIYCAQCHGKYHDGNGTVGQSFEPLPTDLRSERVQFQTDGELFKTVSYGLVDGRQPALATTIAIPERWQIVAYVRSLGVR
ncbi:c-type cytochrome [Desulfococcus multivorans]|uniref:Cytochrome c domain-containing protein n=1 Tax=Desulfococcus multivorans DSM 2059 TaxID=1121405 RepID=S7TZA5_DESML|nr:cytochrome c [Desulfococcus multivorans]AOY59317.1 conserved uncharacterized protein [Desulfococcus multivorans]AQV01536.1 hypothetical protein B2D07_12740 [Desulfococcus multivorans]EPR42382.1 hypothetical protein dsmv_1656 [Desulfococcus multivorans DSM 2059]SKA14526.1 Cytochrome C oxidase, cbb3-type, subunit III [Desulfococcus multivorans DSM 2059]